METFSKTLPWEEEIDSDWLHSHLQALQMKPASPESSTKSMQIQVNDKRNANAPVKVEGTDATALYDTDENMCCMSFACNT